MLYNHDNSPLWYNIGRLTIIVLHIDKIYFPLQAIIMVSGLAADANVTIPLPADTRRWINVGLTLVQRRGRWTNVKPTLIQRIVSAGPAGRHTLSPNIDTQDLGW